MHIIFKLFKLFKLIIFKLFKLFKFIIFKFIIFILFKFIIFILFKFNKGKFKTEDEAETKRWTKTLSNLVLHATQAQVRFRGKSKFHFINKSEARRASISEPGTPKEDSVSQNEDGPEESTILSTTVAPSSSSTATTATTTTKGFTPDAMEVITVHDYDFDNEFSSDVTGNISSNIDITSASYVPSSIFDLQPSFIERVKKTYFYYYYC